MTERLAGLVQRLILIVAAPSVVMAPAMTFLARSVHPEITPWFQITWWFVAWALVFGDLVWILSDALKTRKS